MSPFLVLLYFNLYISKNPKNEAPGQFKIILKCSLANSKNNCFGLQMARMEMDFILKKNCANFFKFIASVSENSQL